LQSRSWEDERGQRRYFTEVNARRVFGLTAAFGDEPAEEAVPVSPEIDDTPDNGTGASDDVPF